MGKKGQDHFFIVGNISATLPGLSALSCSLAHQCKIRFPGVSVNLGNAISTAWANKRDKISRVKRINQAQVLSTMQTTYYKARNAITLHFGMVSSSQCLKIFSITPSSSMSKMICVTKVLLQRKNRGKKYGRGPVPKRILMTGEKNRIKTQSGSSNTNLPAPRLRKAGERSVLWPFAALLLYQGVDCTLLHCPVYLFRCPEI